MTSLEAGSTKGQRIVLVNRFFYPDHSASSQMLSDLAFGLARKGLQVHVVTSRLRYEDPNHALPRSERIGGVTVHRVGTSRFGRGQLWGRGFDYVTFFLAALVPLFKTVRARDALVAMTDPPMLSTMAAVVAWLKGASLYNWLQDLFPEVAAAAGFRTARGPLGYLLRWLRDRSLQTASMNIAIGELMRQRLIERGVRAHKIQVIPNWADGDAITPVPHPLNPLRTAWGLEDCFVVGYSGNAGRAHEFITLLDTAERLLEEPSVRILIIGGGKQRPHLEAEVQRRRLTNVVFKPYQPRALLALSLSVADLHVVSLRPELEGLIVPSKYYGIAAAGRPTLFIGAANGEVARYLAESGDGITVQPGDTEAAVAAIKRSMKAATTDPVSASRTYFVSRFTLQKSLDDWASTLRAPFHSAVAPNEALTR